ncbi:Eco57I restriction-modification methylase domain-containing protein [Halosquirtibacter laminarini]|uniref:Eco57I restriction-modification methylase domain-containing protein n=1 Tax=Halosquirtibacter laminarini TaxID=3374600 RepID=A0AC61NHU6_9BACT|nr:Eco57I restriction-modification methylase domain-containing protein [Prolixibacteraceae bacterium]
MITQEFYNIPYDRESYLNFFKNNLLPESFELIIEDVNSTAKYFTEVTKLGAVEDLNLAIFEIKHSSISDARVGLTLDAYKLMNNHGIENALILFVPQESKNYRLSYLHIENDINDNGQVVSTYRNKRRFSYFLGQDAKTKTAFQYLFGKQSSRINSIEDLENRFSIEVVNKEFFKSYKFHYGNLVEELKNSNLAKVHFSGEDKRIRDFVKKFMGRIVFLYFLQKKGWLGASSTEYCDGDKNFMHNLWENSTKGDSFYTCSLATLFFNGLNEKRPNDDFILENGKKIKIPFLNGGLFHEENVALRNIVFSPKKLEALFNFLDSYNFTINENDPFDQEVGIDPEMLGHIFENLLEDQQSKGAFYTPKEIVHFMVQESLLQYINTGFKKNNVILSSDEQLVLKSIIKEKISYEDIDEDNHHEVVNAFRQSKLTKEHGALLNELLDNIKVCDPAIGSGAFPMAMLNEIYQCKLTINRGLKKEERSELKKHIIENSIYGVDIEKGAVDIAQLRFWLSIVIEEEKPTPLPNLDFKIMVGNSLYSQFGDQYLKTTWDLKSNSTGKNIASRMRGNLQKLTDLQHQYFKTTDKDKLKDEIKNLRADILIDQITFKQLIYKSNDTQVSLDDTSKIEKLKSKLDFFGFEQKKDTLKIIKTTPNKPLNYFDWKMDFPEILNPGIAGVDPGFDIVIGNPPYLRLQGIKENDTKFADLLINEYQSATGAYDLYALFTEKGLQLTKKDGILNFIMPDKWTIGAFGKGLRTFITKENAAQRFISFGEYQVFNASTYTAIQWFKRGTANFKYHPLSKDLKTNRELGDYLNKLCDNDFVEYHVKEQSANTWQLSDGPTIQLMQRINKHSRNLNDIFDKMYQGLATSKDSVYFLYDSINNDNTITGYSKELKRNVTVEKEIVRPLLKGEDVHRYDTMSTSKYVVLPYRLNKQKEKEVASLFTEEELQMYPLAYKYIKECEQVLKGREKGRLSNDDQWFRYIYPKNIVLQKKEKLVAPDISLRSNFAYDTEGEFYHTTTVYGYIKKAEIKEDYLFLMAVLNSKLTWWYMTKNAPVMANGYYRYKPAYLKSFPFPAIDNLKITYPFINIAKMVIYLKKIRSEAPICESVTNEQIQTLLESVIDALVLELYFKDDFEEKELFVFKNLPSQLCQLWSIDENSECNNLITNLYQTFTDIDNPVRLTMNSIKSSLPFIINTIYKA